MTLTTSIPFAKPWITDDERRAVLEVLEGSILTHGPRGAAFEEAFGTFLGDDAHCVTVSSCMAALHLSYIALGIGAGDEVLVPAQTHTATVHAVEWVGAKPVFIDCDPETGNMMPESIERALTSRTKAIAVVHFVGIPCRMPAIMKLAQGHGLKVIEDCALALGARYGIRHVGLFGDAAGFSFYPAKHITSGEGGMFVTRHREVAESVRKLRAFGVDRHNSERSVPGMYDVLTLGLNYRMSELQAAMGLAQLNRIEENLKSRQHHFTLLKDNLKTINGLRIIDSNDPQAQSSHYCLSLILEEKNQHQRQAVMGRLNERGIGTSIYYPHPVPRLTYYRKKYGYDKERYPHAEQISDASLALPVGPHLNEADFAYLMDQSLSILEELKRI